MASFKKYYEAKSSKKRYQEEEIKLNSELPQETHPPSEKFESSVPRNEKKYEKKEKNFSNLLAESDLVASALAYNAGSHSSLRHKRRFCNAPF